MLSAYSFWCRNPGSLGRGTFRCFVIFGVRQIKWPSMVVAVPSWFIFLCFGFVLGKWPPMVTEVPWSCLILFSVLVFVLCWVEGPRMVVLDSGCLGCVRFCVWTSVVNCVSVRCRIHSPFWCWRRFPSFFVVLPCLGFVVVLCRLGFVLELV